MASDIPSLAGPTDVFITNDGQNVYCTSMNNIIYMYSRDTVTGVLTALATPTIATGTTPTKMAFSPDGSLAYVCTPANTIWCYSRDATTGMLTYRSSTAIGYVPTALTITPDGVNMYVISKTGGVYLQYSIQKTTGVLTIIGSATTLTYGNICDVQSSANGKEIHFLFSAPYLHTAKRNPFTGVLTFPYALQSPAGAGVDTFALSPDGGCIYTPLASSSKLAMHPFTPGSGYTNGSQYYDGTNNLYGLSGGSSAAVTPDSTVVWLANGTTGAIVGYDRCSVSGRLVGDGGDRQANIGAAISNIKLSPDGNHIYFVNKTTNAIGRITIDNGMRPLNNIMISAGNYATSMSSWATTQVIQKAFAKPILVKPLNGVFQLYGWLGQPVTIQGTLEMYRLT
jgi:DNA-binding beta-propeller fold protein YncE